MDHRIDESVIKKKTKLIVYKLTLRIVVIKTYNVWMFKSVELF